MAQYIEIKHANPDCLLFYRMGDFYELFFDDAVVAAGALGITLTKRGKHAGADIPMCGVPVHAADDYLQKLIAAGYKVAVCEQMEDPTEAKKRGSKAVVRREVQRLVTPGTITEDGLLDAAANSYLAAVVRDAAAEEGNLYALAWCDLSTGEFAVNSVPAVDLAGEFARIQPRETLMPDTTERDESIATALDIAGTTATPLATSAFDSVAASKQLKAYFQVATLDGFSDLSRAESAVCAAIVHYLDRTQVGRRAPLNPPRRMSRTGTMAIDAATRANLELVRTLQGATKGSLAECIDRTVTAPGRRRLVGELTAPLTDIGAIARRHDAVAHFADKNALRDAVRDALKGAPDIARALSRLGLERGGPRDLAALLDGLTAAETLAGILRGGAVEDISALADLTGTLSEADTALRDTLSAALVDEPPLLRRDGGFVRVGYDAELDDLRSLRDESRRVIATLQTRHAEDTGVKSLKIKHNNVLGYFIEVTAQHADKLFGEETYIHRQTMANAVRFTTVELGELESKIVSAGDRALAIELRIFDDLLIEALARADHLKGLAAALAELDVYASHAALARECNFTRPVVDTSLAFTVKGGRHPVVERALDRDGTGPFVINDCELGPPENMDAGQIWLLTGPNMGGKSTFLRQNAIIAILAQAGAFVPAEEVHIGIVDRLFSRVGAADDLARGRSTFMVEMIETAAILNQAGPASLVILDEIGRGTATFDGLSIAWAAVEHLHDINRCRALFATHFHELTVLASKLDRVANATVKVKEWQGDVVFLHEVVPGAADRSYGVQVAKLAGLPSAVIARARDVLDRLEAGERAGGAKAVVDDLPLFSVKPQTVSEQDPEIAALKDAMSALHPDHMTPREALDAMYRLKAMIAGGKAD